MAKRRANNEGSLYKYRDKWRAQITLNGKRLGFSADTQRECQEWIRLTQTQIDHGLTFDNADMRLEEFLANWLVVVSSSRSRGTTKLYRWTIEKQIIQFIGKIKLKDLRPDQIQSFYDRLKDEGRSPHAIHVVHKVLRVALNHAVKLGTLGLNPCKGVTSPKPQQAEMKFYDQEQVKEFLTTAETYGDRFYPLYYLAIHTGMRQGELLGLKWEDIDWERRSLKVKRQVRHFKHGEYKFSKPKSKSGSRTIILGLKVVSVLQAHQINQNRLITDVGEDWVDLDLVFASNMGTPVTASNLRRSFRKIINLSGLPKIRFHDLRHTAASLMLNNGIPILVASRRLGHSKPSMTMDVYGHIIPNKEEEAADLMDNLISPSVNLVAHKLHTKQTKNPKNGDF